MALLNNNIQSLLNLTKSDFSSIVGSNGSSSSIGGLNVNSVFELLSQGQVAYNGGDEQRAKTIIDMVKTIIGMLSSINNETSKANKEVNEKETKANELDSESEGTASDIEAQLADIINNVTANTTTINQAITKLQELGGKDGQSGKVKEIQEQLKKQLDIIDAQKSIINNENSTKTEKYNALAIIQAASEEIGRLSVQINNILNEIISQNKIVETAASNIENLFAQGNDVAEKGVTALQEDAANGVSQIVSNGATATEGAADETAGATLQATGFIPIIGAKTAQKGTDLFAAGGIRIAGSANNIKTLGTTIGKIGSSISSIAENFGAVGELVNSAADFVGQYGTQLQAIITATGSWSTIDKAKEELDNAIASAKTTLDTQNNTQEIQQTQQAQQRQSVQQNQQGNSNLQTENNNMSTGEQKKLIFNYNRLSFGI